MDSDVELLVLESFFDEVPDEKCFLTSGADGIEFSFC